MRFPLSRSCPGVVADKGKWTLKLENKESHSNLDLSEICRYLQARHPASPVDASKASASWWVGLLVTLLVVAAVVGGILWYVRRSAHPDDGGQGAPGIPASPAGTVVAKDGNPVGQPAAAAAPGSEGSPGLVDRLGPSASAEIPPPQAS